MFCPITSADEPHSFVFAYFSSPWRRPHVSYTVISAAASVGNVTFKVRQGEVTRGPMASVDCLHTC